ncbi:MAG: hypothetical protein WC592_06480 [Candidatus Omnitrophota bacterium]|nr:DUF2934 domain-containing protein [Candidatus Omnitrophota bacterium]
MALALSVVIACGTYAVDGKPGRDLDNWLKAEKAIEAEYCK